MLIRFTVSNFLSFKEPTTFDMLAQSKQANKQHEHHVHEEGGYRLLKAAAIYGANASGKSNFVKAIDFFKDSIVSELSTNQPLSIPFKGIETNTKEPSSFEAEFLIDGELYTYGLTCNRSSILEEWLYFQAKSAEEQKMIYEYDSSIEDNPIKYFDKKIKDNNEIIRAVLLLEETHNADNRTTLLNRICQKVKEGLLYKLFETIAFKTMTVLPGARHSSITMALIQKKELHDFFNDLITTWDTGICEMRIESTTFEEFYGKNEIEKAREQREWIENNTESFQSIGGEKSEYAIAHFDEETGKAIEQYLAFYNHNCTEEFTLLDQSDGHLSCPQHLNSVK
jgi:hypothetical protein